MVFEESPQAISVRVAEPDEIVSPFKEPLVVDADDPTPVMSFDNLDAVPVRRVRVQPQLDRFKPPSVPSPEEEIEESVTDEADKTEEEAENLEEETHLPVLLTSEELLNTLCSLLDRDYSLLLNKVGNRYVLKGGAQEIPQRKFPMTKEKAEDLAITDEYRSFTERWQELSLQEKAAYAKKAGAEYDGDLTEKTAGARLKRSVLRTEGISKWKPEYRHVEARTKLWKEGIYADPL